MDLLQSIINQRPALHRRETEIDRPFAMHESWLSYKTAEKLANTELTCYGVDKEVLSFIGDHVDIDSKTLETGAGCSTLIFALRGSDHIAVTPSQSEITLITSYAATQGISMKTVNFVQESSDRFLPRCEADGFDLVLLDGKHAFPWPVVDWFYTADKLKQGGLMIIDDAGMRSVSILADFMNADTGWQMVYDFSGKTIVYKKNRSSIHDVAWHMQRYSVASPFERITNRIKKFVKR